jgi:hypothetical protein
MLLSKGFRISLIVIACLLVILVLLPNIFNKREQEAFGDEERVLSAKSSYAARQLGDSVTIVPGPYYEKSNFHKQVFGELNRAVWEIPVKAAVLRLNHPENRYDTLKFSGSMQTIGIDVKDAQERVWSIRSVNKDQSKALPGILQPTIIRSMIRDQAAALNPYGALVVPVLAYAIGLHHTNPKLYLFPFAPALGRYNDRMAGRLVIMEEEADESWEGEPEFKDALKLMDTEEMLQAAKTDNIAIDTLLYARSRLFDMLISDWDRHEGNWQWALVRKDNNQLIQPIPVDRDMAFYNYQEGSFTKVVLLLNNKFQSFSPDFKDIDGLMHQSEALDGTILRNISREKLKEQAFYIQNQLSKEVIQEAFSRYPPEVYQAIGSRHEEILRSRLEKLPQAAERFHELLKNR